jgi:hypothetical protein
MYPRLSFGVSFHESPGCLQQHDGVLSLVGAGGSHLAVCGWEVATRHVAVTATRQTTRFNTNSRIRSAHSFQAAGN